MNATDYSGTGQVRPLAVEGNEGVVQAVAKNPDAIGFADFGFAERDTGVRENPEIKGDCIGSLHYRKTFPVRGNVSGRNWNRGDQNNTYYISRLTRPLLYITKGNPTTLENDFITFAMSPGTAKFFDDVGYFSINEFSSPAK